MARGRDEEAILQLEQARGTFIELAAEPSVRRVTLASGPDLPISERASAGP